MEKNKICVVTAFFDIGRGEYKSALRRSADDYLKYFEFWCRLRNDMIIFTEKKFEEKLKKISQKYRRDNTTIIVIDDVYEIEKGIYERMKKIEAKGSGLNLKYHDKALSGRADYDYIMLMKYYFLQKVQAEKLQGNADFLAWIDFGFNHGGELYTKPEEFDFLWEYPFAEKINVMSLRGDFANISPLETLIYQNDVITGSVVVVVGCADILYDYMLEQMQSLLNLETIDDDQQLLFMALNEYKDSFNVYICDWFMIFKMFGNDALTIREDEKIKKLFTLPHIKSVNRAFSKRVLNYSRKVYPQNG